MTNIAILPAGLQRLTTPRRDWVQVSADISVPSFNRIARQLERQSQRMKKSKPPSAKYMVRAQALAEAIDIGMPLFRPMTEAERETIRNPASDEEQIASNRAFCLDIRQKALSPEPPLAALRSLAYLEEAFFTSWNEGVGEHVEQFWQLIAERGLPFERRDVIREVLTRGRIRNDIEFQAVTDAIIVLRHIGKISDEEAAQLSDMLEAFERRALRRR